MRNLAFALTLLLGAGLPALAQENPKAEFFGGFSYHRQDFAVLSDSGIGWQAAIHANFSPYLGLTADFGGQYGKLLGLSFRDYQLLVGPRFIGRGERVTGFAHFLFGVRSLRGLRALGLGGTNFAMGFGGGTDVSLNDRISIRVMQFDYIPTKDVVWLTDYRFGAGIVLKFGGGQ